MKRPMVYILIFFIAGLLLGRHISEVTDAVFFTGILFIISYALCRITGDNRVLVIPALFFVAAFLLQRSVTPKNHIIENMVGEGKSFRIECIVVDKIGVTRKGYEKIIVRANRFAAESPVIEEEMKLLIFTEEPVEIGQNIMLNGKLLFLDAARNPGAYSEFRFYRSRKIQYKMFPEYIETGYITHNFTTAVYGFRSRINDVYDKILPAKEASIIKAMVTGDRNNLDGDIRELYRAAGIYHILAISGLHISIIYGFLIFIVDRIGRYKLAYAVLAFLAFYCFFTGFGVSTVRAVIMCSTIIVAKLLDRDYDFVSSICFSCVVLLMYEPLYLWDVGFLYSFASVIGIALLHEPFCKLFTIDFFKYYVNTCLSVFFANKIVQVFFFYTAGVIEIFVNILLLPFVCIIIIFGIAAGLAGLVSITPAIFLAAPVYILLKIFEAVCSFSLKLPYNNILIGRPHMLMIILYCAVLCSFSYMMYNKGIRKFEKYFYACTVLFVLALFISKIMPRQVEVTMLDVSQGDCFLVSGRDFNFIVDGGGTLQRELGDDAGINVLLPYLSYKGMDSVDTVFISHTDEDHVKGIIEILPYVKIGRIILPDKKYDDELDKLLILKSEEYKIPIQYMTCGDKKNIGDAADIECLYPFEDTYGDKNNSSLVIKFVYKNISFLFTGDIEKEAEEMIIRHGKNIGAHVLKVPHHGSKTSSTPSFVQGINPLVALISAGRNNVYKHPSAETLKTLEENNIRIYNTAECGAVIIKTDGEHITVNSMIEGGIFGKTD